MNNAPQIPKRDTSKAHVFSMKEKLSKIDRYSKNIQVGAIRRVNCCHVERWLDVGC